MLSYVYLDANNLSKFSLNYLVMKAFCIEQAVRQMTSYAEELRAELASKDEKIMSLQEKLSHVEPSLRQERPVMKSNSSVKASTVSGQLRSKNAPNVVCLLVPAFLPRCS